jgi:hypothetical protein
MMFLPAARFLTEPRPPADLAARFLAAVILPPLLFFAIWKSPLESRFSFVCSVYPVGFDSYVLIFEPHVGHSAIA